MSDELKVKALELANAHAAPPADIVTRAAAYHSFLSGAAVGGKPATAQAGKPTTAATGKPATAAAGKPATAAGKPGAAGKAGTAGKGANAAPATKYNVDQVRDMVRKVATTDGLGKQSALDILDEEAGVQNVSLLKPADYDKVYEACEVALGGAGGEAAGGDAAEEFDPTA